ncbi:hypothetical protein DL96DRAFT_1572373 [Flagelloscypha sp. PMI_526]|nr:hypothetical protein DL96DRAFT_1572373 [Flagelloscypha sp. PMI_526]
MGRRPAASRANTNATATSAKTTKSVNSNASTSSTRSNQSSIPPPEEWDPFWRGQSMLGGNSQPAESERRQPPNPGPPKGTLSLRLDLNLDVHVEIKAKIHGDVTLSLLKG